MKVIIDSSGRLSIRAQLNTICGVTIESKSENSRERSLLRVLNRRLETLVTSDNTSDIAGFSEVGGLQPVCSTYVISSIILRSCQIIFDIIHAESGIGVKRITCESYCVRRRV